jgi:hypothetical protein
LKHSLARPVVFGCGDGMVSLIGAVLYLSAHHPALVFPVGVTSGATAAVSMAGFDWLSDDTDHGFGESCVLGAATWAGSMLPAIPFAFTRGAAAVAMAVVICLAIVAVIAMIRPNRGKGLSLIETGAVLAAAFAAVLICGVIFPGGAA